ncbi:Monocarboxylate transporter [Paragonimus heterotremus]|uniref:Monocarboxylate transporter n=1 Tax=Paragonimus heterotremus TaxID=100268 RepID=A0A8J4X0N2_9TREM|nr:Monocarboxylate transporter [Paragonimus heterotremus]
MNAFQQCLIVIGGFICYFLADGYTYSIGILYSYFLTEFGLSGSATAVLPGLLYAVPQFTGLFLCPLLETYGYSSGAAWGAILLSVSCIGSAFAPNLQVLYLTFGVLASFGLQLTYSSAIMAVTVTFKDHKYFGLAVGLAMCGSGIGSFASSPFVAWLLESWTWREVMIIESAILLHSYISASCFHHLDATRFNLPRPAESVQVSTFNSATASYSRPSSTAQRSSLDRLFRFFRYLLCIPSRYRFRRTYSPLLPPEPKPSKLEPVSSVALEADELEQAYDSGCHECWKALIDSLRQLTSPKLWTNPTFISFILANALTGAGVVIPWTFIYDHGVISLNKDNDLDVRNASLIAWLPSLIGIGSLLGQILFGLITSPIGQFKRLSNCFRRPVDVEEPGTQPVRARFCRRIWSVESTRLLILFLAVLLWNALTTLTIALLPLPDLAGKLSSEVSLFSVPIGQAMAAACLCVGISYGGLYVLYPQILMNTLGEELWAAGLGIYLLFNGAMNLIGTTIGGQIFDSTGSYKSAFIFAACVPLVGMVITTCGQIIQFRRNRYSGSSSQ